MAGAPPVIRRSSPNEVTHTVFATSFGELLRITGGTPATVAADA